jgi:hypothetical protein
MASTSSNAAAAGPSGAAQLPQLPHPHIILSASRAPQRSCLGRAALVCKSCRCRLTMPVLTTALHAGQRSRLPLQMAPARLNPVVPQGPPPATGAGLWATATTSTRRCAVARRPRATLLTEARVRFAGATRPAATRSGSDFWGNRKRTMSRCRAAYSGIDAVACPCMSM